MPKRLLAPLLVLALAAVVGASGVSAEPGRVAAKRAQAQQVLAEIEAIDMELDRAVDAWNGARLELGRIEARLADNQRRLAIARTNYRRTQRILAARVVALYTSDEPTALEVILGSASVTDLLDRLETVENVTAEDARIAGEVQATKAEVARRQTALVRARARQAELVADLEARRASIEGRLAERRRLYASVDSEIASLEAAERERQARLAAEARKTVAAARRQARTTEEPVEEQQPADTATTSQPSSPAPQPSSQPPSPSPPAPAPSSRGARAAQIALRYLGIPYRWGGASPSTGFDCSGFTMFVYRQVGVSLPHYTVAQYGYGRAVSRGALAPGDLVFFNGLSHVGIYIGGGRFVHSPHTGDVVKISSLSDSWYASTWVGARRL
jgi:cell wall-associated NlpC family hydrolase